MKPDRAGGGIPSAGVALADSDNEDFVAAVDEATGGGDMRCDAAHAVGAPAGRCVLRVDFSERNAALLDLARRCASSMCGWNISPSGITSSAAGSSPNGRPTDRIRFRRTSCHRKGSGVDADPWPRAKNGKNPGICLLMSPAGTVLARSAFSSHRCRVHWPEGLHHDSNGGGRDRRRR